MSCNCKKNAEKKLRLTKNKQNHSFLEDTYNPKYDTSANEPIYPYDISNPRDSLELEDSINNFNQLDYDVDYDAIDDDYERKLAYNPLIYNSNLDYRSARNHRFN